MTIQVILGLPYLSNGPLLQTARRLRAPVLLSANAFARTVDHGPVPAGFEFTRMERYIRRRSGDERPPSARQKARRMREWSGWNLSSLKHAEGMEVHLDSAGFVAMAAQGGFSWTPESYILDLCAKHPFTRFSSMDLCVEEEVAADAIEVRERIARTVALNRQCHMLSCDAGIEGRLMSVIQGATPEDYLRCFDSISDIVPEGATIGVGSMCRRDAAGPNGVAAVIEYLDGRLPPDTGLHLFGVKSTAAEEVGTIERVRSIDSQAYGITARQKANEIRRTRPDFSKSNAFTAGIMEKWYLSQVSRMEACRPVARQQGFSFPLRDPPPATVADALEIRARAEINEMLATSEMQHDQIVSHHLIWPWMTDWLEEMPDGVRLTDPFVGLHQLPGRVRSNDPYVDPGSLPACMRP